MTLSKTIAFVGLTLPVAALIMGCQSGGIGDPCTPEDEYQPAFSGYKDTEVNVESRSFQCETRLCLVNHFRGRVSCPYGQTDEEIAKGDSQQRCHIPGTSDKDNLITAKVEPQCGNRRAADTVYCSCRCAGPDPNARYCECPKGYECKELLRDIGLGSKELAGSYCIKENTEYPSKNFLCNNQCDPSKAGTGRPGDCGSFDGR
jgi:hypothetical protein